MHTHSKSSIIVPKKHFNLSVSQSLSPIPSNYCSALKDPNWLSAMREEYNALMNQNTWTLAPRLVGANVVMDKWIFCHKFNIDGSLARYKACWVVRGFTQWQGVDYEETFSPVIKLATIRVILNLAISKDWLRLQVKQILVCFKTSSLHLVFAVYIFLISSWFFRTLNPTPLCLFFTKAHAWHIFCYMLTTSY
jgi:hypothetical protein